MKTLFAIASLIFALALTAYARTKITVDDGVSTHTFYDQPISATTAAGEDLGAPTIIPIKRAPGQKGRDHIEWTRKRCQTFDMDGTPHWTEGACH